MPSVQFEESKFLKFLYNYLLSVRHKMWTKSGIESEGQYAVTQEISYTLRHILENDQKHQKQRDMITQQLKKNFMQIEKLSIQEIEVIFSIISGGSLLTVQPGQVAITKDNQVVTILGFSDTWKQQTELVQQDNALLSKIHMNIDLKQESQKLVAIFLDPISQESHIEVFPFGQVTYSQIIKEDSQNQKKIGQMSLLNDMDIIKHFISILQYNKDEMKSLSEMNKILIKQLQLHIIKSISHMINVCGAEFLQKLQSEKLLEQFITHLYKTSEGNLKDKTLVPIDWIELKCSIIKKTALENDLSLIQCQDQMTVNVQNGKQLVFKALDPVLKDLVIQNTYLTSGINLHNVPKDRNYECLMSKDVTNFNFGEAQGRQYGLVFVEGQELLKLEDKSINILLHSQAILTTSDISAKELFTKMVELVKKDDEKPQQERKLEGLLETVILFTKKQDFERVQQPLKLNIKPLFKQAPSAIEGLLRELKEWGEVDRDIILQRIEAKEGMNFSTFVMNACKILKEVAEEKQKNKDKLKKLETDKKLKEMDLFTKKLEEIDQKRLKDLNEKRDNICKLLNLGGGEVKSFVSNLVDQANDQMNSDDIFKKQEDKNVIKEENKGEEDKKEKEEKKIIEGKEVLDLMKDEKSKEKVIKIIEKSIKEPWKQIDADEIKKKSDEEINKLFFSSVKTIDESILSSEYEQALDTLCNMYSKSSLTNIISNANLEKLLPFLLKDKKSQKLFTCFLKSEFTQCIQLFLSSGSNEKLKSLGLIIEKVFSVCEKEAEFSMYMKNFFFYEIINTGIKTIKTFQETAPTKVMDYYNTEEKILTQLNPYFLKFMTKLYMKVGNDIILEQSSYIPNLFNIHLAMALYFQSDSIILKKIYKSILNLLAFIGKNLNATVKNGSLQSLLHNELLHEIISQIDFDHTEKKYTSQQKLLLEIHMKLLDIHKEVLDKAIGQLDSNLENSIGILKVKRGKQVLNEREKFQFLKYYIHFKGLEEHQTDLLNQNIETNHYAFDSKILAKFSMKQVERMDITFGENCAMKDFSFVGISNNSKGINMDIIDPDQIKKDFKEMGIKKNEFYLFYPLKKQIVISFGENLKGRLGQTGQSNGPKMSLSTKDLEPSRIYSSFWHSILIDKDGHLHKAGQLKHIGSENTEFTKTALAQKVRQVACGKTTVIAITDDYKVFGHGYSKDGHLGPNTNYDQFIKMPFGDEEESAVLSSENKIIDLSSGTHYTLFVTESGKLYGCGNRFMKEIGLDNDNKIISIPLQEGLKVKRVWACMSKKQPLAIIKVENDKGEELLMSAGKNEQGLLGQGQLVKISKSFKPVRYDNINIKFKDLSLHTDHVMAITNEGQLYAWGSNISKRSGFNEELFDGVFEPKKVDFIEKENIKILKVSCGFDHTLLLCEDNNDQSNIKLYSVGSDEKNFNHLGISQIEAEEKDKYYREISQFRGFKILDFTAGYRSSYVIIEGDKQPVDNLYNHQIISSIGKKEEQVGILHFYKNKDGQMVYITQNDYEKQKQVLPDICFAIKCPIKDMESKNYPDLDEICKDMFEEQKDEDVSKIVHTKVKCVLTEQEIVGPRYFSFTKINNDDQIINLCEEQFKQPNPYDINPLIYYRIKRPLKTGSFLPMMDLKQYYKESAVYGLEIKIKPDLEYTPNSQLVKLTQQSFDELGDLMSKFLPECDNELLLEMDKYIKVTLADKEIANIKAKEDFKIQDMTFKNPKLKKMAEAVKRKRIELYLSFNNIFLELMPYIEIQKKVTEGSISAQFYNVKMLILTSIKNKFIKAQISTLPQGDTNSVDIKRRKAQRFVDSGKVDHKGEHTIFGQIYQSVKKATPTFTNFRHNNTDDKSWSAQFAGEGAIDAGGPYRDSLSNICQELESEVLPLLIKTPNNRNNHGQNRDCFILNPISVTPIHMDMFKFFGCLIGFAIRTLSALNLHLAPIFWKQLIGDKVELIDLKGSDTYTWQIIEDLKKQSEKLSSQEFDNVVNEYFVTCLSNGNEVELCKEGKERKVTKENLNEYIQLLLDKRFKESEMQLNAVREGVFFVIPLDMIKILTWEEIETRCCGDKIVDIAKLKTITQYNCCSEKDECIERFWRVLEAFSDEEKLLYLKFVWGRSRLPAEVTNLRSQHTIYFCSYKTDKEFPEAHTCFFQLDLPKYTTDEICKTRLITAITMCGEIDTDRSSQYIDDDNDEE